MLFRSDIYRQTPENIGFTSLTPYSVTCDGTRKSFTGIASATATYSNITIISRLSDTSATPIEISNLMIEENPTPTAYTPYQNLDGYDNYSTGEVMIGTWIDGKPLYRKVVDTGQISSTTKTVAHNVIAMDICTDIRGIAYFNNNTFYILPRVGTASLNHQCTLYCNRTNIYLQAGSDCNFDGSFVIIEYTKTTD